MERDPPRDSPVASHYGQGQRSTKRPAANCRSLAAHNHGESRRPHDYDSRSKRQTKNQSGKHRKHDEVAPLDASPHSVDGSAWILKLVKDLLRERVCPFLRRRLITHRWEEWFAETAI